MARWAEIALAWRAVAEHHHHGIGYPLHLFLASFVPPFSITFLSIPKFCCLMLRLGVRRLSLGGNIGRESGYGARYGLKEMLDQIWPMVVGWQRLVP